MSQISRQDNEARLARKPTAPEVLEIEFTALVNAVSPTSDSPGTAAASDKDVDQVARRSVASPVGALRPCDESPTERRAIPEPCGPIGEPDCLRQ
jgi:hypothetical protein